jgi:hypothetical protein
MFEPVVGQHYDTIQTENVARVIWIMHRLDKDGRTYLIPNDNSSHIIIVCQMECDASDIARAMIESGCSFEYHNISLEDSHALRRL